MIIIWIIGIPHSGTEKVYELFRKEGKFKPLIINRLPSSWDTEAIKIKINRKVELSHNNQRFDLTASKWIDTIPLSEFDFILNNDREYEENLTDSVKQIINEILRRKQLGDRNDK